jgi:hypothetical protein
MQHRLSANATEPLWVQQPANTPPPPHKGLLSFVEVVSMTTQWQPAKIGMDVNVRKIPLYSSHVTAKQHVLCVGMAEWAKGHWLV